MKLQGVSFAVHGTEATEITLAHKNTQENPRTVTNPSNETYVAVSRNTDVGKEREVTFSYARGQLGTLVDISGGSVRKVKCKVKDATWTRR